jgi:pyridoxine/pyridoxamine 5'-phosphate oxidase
VPEKIERIVYQLVRVDIDKAPPYVAISYTWRNLNDTAQIRIEGEILEIPRNLAEPLAYYRVERPHIYLWADSICINQRDLVERSSQVRADAKLLTNIAVIIAAASSV